MEPIQLISEEWGSLSGLYTAEEADFMAQLLGGNYSVTDKHCGNPSFGMPMPSSTIWHGHESTTLTLTSTNSNSYFPSNVTNTNFLSFSQGSTSSTDSGSFQWNDKLTQQITQSINEESGRQVLTENNLQAKREYHEMMVSEPAEEERSRNLENPTKRFRNSIEVIK